MYTPIASIYSYEWRYVRKLLICHLSRKYILCWRECACLLHTPHLRARTHSMNILLNGWSIDRINRLSVLLFFIRYVWCMCVTSCAWSLLAVSLAHEVCLSNASAKSYQTPSLSRFDFQYIYTQSALSSFNVTMILLPASTHSSINRGLRC